MAIIWNIDRHELWDSGSKCFELIPDNYKVVQPTPIENVELIIKTAVNGNLITRHVYIHIWNDSPIQPDEEIDYIIWMGEISDEPPENWWEIGTM